VCAGIDGDDPATKADERWTTDFSYAKEDQDDEHLLVLGGRQSFDNVVADPRSANLAHRLWDPIFLESRR